MYGDLTVTAKWEKVALDVGKCMGTSEVKYAVGTTGSGGEVFPWLDETSPSGYSVKFSAKDNGASWVEMVVTNAVKIAFDWKCSCEGLFKDQRCDYLSFSIDGDEKKWICGEADWNRVDFTISANGVHRLRWTYSKDIDTLAGEDCGWIAGLVIKNQTKVSFAGSGGESGTFPAAIAAYTHESITLPDPVGVSYPKHEFVGWSDGSKTYAAGATYPVSSLDKTLVAVWKEKRLVAPVITVAEKYDEESTSVLLKSNDGAAIYYTTDGTTPSSAHGNRYSAAFKVTGTVTIKAICVKDDWFDSAVASKKTVRSWTSLIDSLGADAKIFTIATGGSANWIGDAANKCVKSSATVSGWLTASFSGAGVVEWEEKTASSDWVRKTKTFDTTGSHQLKWEGSGLAVRNLKYSAAVWARFVLGDDCTGTAPSAICSANGYSITLPSANGFAYARHSFAGWNDGKKTVVAGAAYIVGASDVTFTAVWAERRLATPSISAAAEFTTANTTVTITSTDSGVTFYYTLDGTTPASSHGVKYAKPFVLSESAMIRAVAVKSDCFDSAVASKNVKRLRQGDYLGVPEWTFDNGGNADWAYVETVGNVSMRAMRSGTITHGQKSVLTATMHGCGTLSFQCRTSSEYAKATVYDGLAVYVDDGPRQVWIGGEVDWKDVEVKVVGEGDHVIKWSYEKDSGGDAGEDCAWIKDVKWMGTSHQVHFNANGGEGSMQGINVPCRGSMTLPRNEFAREGYVFYGWATHADGAAIGTGGETVAMPEVSATGTITLYAIWKLETGLLVPGATLDLAPASTNFTVPVRADSSTTWTAQSQAPWISMGASASGQGDGAVEVLVSANDTIEAREGQVLITPTHTTPDPDLHRGLVLWITEEANREGNESRKLSHPLSQYFDGSFSSGIVGPAFPAKSNDDISLAFSFKVDELGITNEIMKVGNQSVYLDADNVLWYHKINTQYRIAEPGRFHTMVVRYQATTFDHGIISVFAGEKGEEVSFRKATSNEWHVVAWTSPLAMNKFMIGQGAYPLAANFRSGMIENIRIWSRALSPAECRMVDELGSCAISPEAIPQGLPRDVAYEYLPLDGNAFQVSQTNVLPVVQNVALMNWTETSDRHDVRSSAISSEGDGRVVIRNFDDRFAKGESNVTYSVWLRVDELPVGGDAMILDRALIKDGEYSSPIRLSVAVTPEGKLRIYTWDQSTTPPSEKRITTNAWHLLTVVGRASRDATLYLDGEKIKAVSTTMPFGYHDHVGYANGFEAVFTLGGWKGAAEGLTFFHSALTAEQVRDLYGKDRSEQVLCKVRQEGWPVEIGDNSRTCFSWGGSLSVSVSVANEATWSAKSMCNWISIDGEDVRKGSDSIRLLVDANTSADPRIGMVVIAGKQCVIAQDGDSSIKIRVDPSEVTLPMWTKGAPFSVIAPQDVSWTAKAASDWLSLESGSSGIGNGTVWYSVASNDWGATRGGWIEVSQRKENVISDVFRGLLVWIQDRDNVEGNEHRWMSYPLSKTFDGTFKNCCNGCALPNKDNYEMTLAFSFKLSELGRSNPLFELTDARCWAIDADNHLHYYRKADDKQLEFVVEDADSWYTLLLRFHSGADNCFYFGRSGEMLTRGQLQGYGNDLYSSIREVKNIQFGYCYHRTASYLQGGQIGNIRLWGRALSDDECQRVDLLGEGPMSEDDFPAGIHAGVAWDYLPLDGNAFQTTQTNIMPVVRDVLLTNWTSTVDHSGRTDSAIESRGDGRVIISNFNDWFAEEERDATYSVWINVRSRPVGGDVPVLRRVLYSGGKEMSNARLVVSLTPQGKLKILTGTSNVSEFGNMTLSTNKWYQVTVVGREGKSVELYLSKSKMITHLSDIRLGYLATAWDSRLEIGGWDGAVEGLAVIHSELLVAEAQELCRKQAVLSASFYVSQFPYGVEMPEINNNGTKGDVYAALCRAADGRLRSNVTSVEAYQNFREWASQVKEADGKTIVDPAVVLQCPRAWMSFVLRADKLLQRDPVPADLKVEKFLATAGKAFDFEISLADVGIGSNASINDLRKIFWIEGTADLNAQDFSADNVAMTFGAPGNGRLRLSAGPKDQSRSSFFMKAMVNPNGAVSEEGGTGGSGSSQKLLQARYEGYLGLTDTLMWSGVRLESIKSFSGYLGGSYINNGKPVSAKGYNIKRVSEGLTVQFQASKIKCVSVMLTQVGNDIYGRVRYVNYTEDTFVGIGVDFDFLPKGNTTVNTVTSDDGKGYGVKDITITYSE